MKEPEFKTANGCAMPDEIKHHNPEIVNEADKPLTMTVPHVISSEYFNVGISLKNFRKIRGYTLRQVESATGVSNPVISQIETGKVKNSSFMTVITLLQFYRVNVNIEI